MQRERAKLVATWLAPAWRELRKVLNELNWVLGGD